MKIDRLLKLAAAGLVAVMLGGCSAMVAQNPSSPLKPVSAMRSGDDARLMLNGADVVAYFTMGKFVQGAPQYRSRFEEVNFQFANAEHKALFDAAPQKYLPQFGGFCATGIVYAIPWEGEADRFAIIDGKLYIFSGQGSLDAFNLDVAGNLKLADQYWADEVAGTNSLWQRSKRLVIRVPQYKSSEELARMVAEAKAKKGG